MIKFYKLFLMVVISFFISFNFISIKKDKLENEVEQYFRYLSDTIYRYQINVFNSKVVTNEKINSEEILYFKPPRINEKVKDISYNINDLFRLLNENEIIQDNLWTVANIYPNYMYIKPYRDGYKELIENRTINDGGYFDYLVEIEKIERNLEPSNLNVYETMKVYGPYLEDETHEKLITIYYPLYLGKKIESILLLDIKYDFLNDFLSDFNKKNITYFSLDENKKINNFIFDVIAKQNFNEKMDMPIKSNYVFFLLLSTLIFCFLFLVHSSISYLVKNINDNKKDKLTGLYRKDCFDTDHHSINCIIVIDIDHFKKVNDTYGHLIGDSVITEVSTRIRNAIRKTDIGVRWGGEEFVIIFGAEINATDLKMKLNELLHLISGNKICNIDVTISIGAFLSPHKIALSDGFKYADEALYESKRTGRNKYTMSVMH